MPTETNLKPVSETDELGWSIDTTAHKTAESDWTVKQKLRNGIYKAVKSGRRTLIIPASVRAHFASLPAATYLPPRKK
jgi:hypothetical protein